MGMFRRAFGLTGEKAAYDPDQWTSSTSVYGLDAYPQTIELYEGQFRDFTSIYRTQPAVRQVIDFRARNIAQVPLQVFDRVGDTERKRLAGHPLEALLKRPNPESTYFEWARDLVTDLDIFDVSYWGIISSGSMTMLVRLHPDAISFKGGDGLAPAYFVQQHADGTTTEWPRESVFWLHGYGGRRGISPMETLRQYLSEEEAMVRHRTGLFRNGLRNAGVIERPIEAPPWSDDARRNFRDSLTARYTGGANAGRPLILEEGMTWKSDQVNLAQTEVVASRQLVAESVATLYGLTPEVMGLKPAPYASIRVRNEMLYQNNLAPTLEFIAQAVEAQLLPLFEPRPSVYVEFNLEAKLRGSFEEQSALLSTAVAGPWMTPNEARALRNLPPLEGGDELNTGGGGIQPSEATGATESDEDPSQAPGPQDEPKMAQKAGESPQRALLRRRDRYAKDIEAVVATTLDRMATRKEKAGPAFKAATFRSELRSDIRPVFERVVLAEAARKAAQRGGEFDPKFVQHYLDKGADLFAGNVVRAGNETLDDHGSDDVDGAKVALAAIAARVALGQASHLASFAREEAGRQTGASKKTWLVTSAKSRHPELDGEQAPLGAPFSNGLAYPGDPSGSPDQTGGCQCLLDIS